MELSAGILKHPAPARKSDATCIKLQSCEVLGAGGQKERGFCHWPFKEEVPTHYSVMEAVTIRVHV
jgi:hypothetical protein